jgi:hypothetical protein
VTRAVSGFEVPDFKSLTAPSRLNCGPLQHHNSMSSSSHMLAWSSCVLLECSLQIGTVTGLSVDFHSAPKSAVHFSPQTAGERNQHRSSLRDSITTKRHLSADSSRTRL